MTMMELSRYNNCSFPSIKEGLDNYIEESCYHSPLFSATLPHPTLTNNDYMNNKGIFCLNQGKWRCTSKESNGNYTVESSKNKISQSLWLQCVSCGESLYDLEAIRHQGHLLCNKCNDAKQIPLKVSKLKNSNFSKNFQTSSQNEVSVKKQSKGSSSRKKGSICSNCGSSSSTLWRRNMSGETVCNACGLYHKLHGINRPMTMRKDAIQTRKRKPKVIKNTSKHPCEGKSSASTTKSEIECGFQVTKEKSKKCFKSQNLACHSYYQDVARETSFCLSNDNLKTNQHFTSHFHPNLLQQSSTFQFRSLPATSNFSNYYEANIHSKASKYSGGFVVGAGSTGGIYLGSQTWSNHQPYIEINTPQNSFIDQSQIEFGSFPDNSPWSRHSKFYDFSFSGDSFNSLNKQSFFNIPSNSNSLHFVPSSCYPAYNYEFDSPLEDLYKFKETLTDDDKLLSPLCKQSETKISPQRNNYSACSSEEHSRSDFDARLPSGLDFCEQNKILINKTSVQADLPLYGVASIPMAVPVTSDGAIHK